MKNEAYLNNYEVNEWPKKLNILINELATEYSIDGDL